MIGQARFTYSSLSKVFKKQAKATEYQGEKQAKVLRFFLKTLIYNIFSDNQLTNFM